MSLEEVAGCGVSNLRPGLVGGALGLERFGVLCFLGFGRGGGGFRRFRILGGYRVWGFWCFGRSFGFRVSGGLGFFLVVLEFRVSERFGVLGLEDFWGFRVGFLGGLGFRVLGFGVVGLLGV